MYVIFNLDGSIKEQNINEFIQQDNNEVNTVQVAIVGKEPLTYTMGIRCKLPNDEVVCFSSFETTKITDSKSDTYNGYEFEIPSTVTALAGIVRVNIVCLDSSSNKKLVTYSLYLSVNEGKENDVAAVISEQEYYNLLDHIGGTSVYGTHADGAWTTITISGITKIIPTGEDISNLVNKIQYDASEKTMGELANVIDGSGVVGLNLSGLGNYNGIYFGSIYQSSSNVYFEIERFSHDGVYSKDRWVGSCAASTLISDVLTSSSSYYQPYALAKELNIKWDNYVSGTSTLADLYNFITNNTFKQVVTAIVRFAEGGVYSVSFVKTSAEATTYGFEMEEYASVTKNNAASRYVGTNVSGDTILSAIMEKTSPYYFPYLTKNNGIESVYVTVGNKTIKDIYDEVYHDNDGQLKFLELWDSTQGGLTGRYLGWMIKTSNNYYFDFDYISPQLDNTNARFMGGPLTGSEGFGDVFSTSGEFYHPIASNPMTATGDLIIGGSSGLPARLAKGSAGQILAMNSQGTTPEWTTAPSGLHLYRHHVVIMATNAGNVSFIYVDIYSGSNSSIDNLAKLHAATDGKNITCSGYFRSNTVYYPNVISISTTSSTVSIVYFATNSTETGTLIDSNTTSLIGDTVQTIY